MKRKFLSMALAAVMTASVMPTLNVSAALEGGTIRDLLADSTDVYSANKWKVSSENSFTLDGTGSSISFTNTRKADRTAYYTIAGADSQDEVDVSFDIELEAASGSRSVFSVRSAQGDLLTVKNSGGSALEVNGTETNFTDFTSVTYNNRQNVKTTGVLHVSAELYFGSVQGVKKLAVTGADNTSIYSSGNDIIPFTYMNDAPESAASSGVLRLQVVEWTNNSADPSVAKLSNVSVIADTSVSPVITSKVTDNTVDIYPNESAILASISNYSTDYAPNDYSGEDGSEDELISIEGNEYQRYKTESGAYYVVINDKRYSLNSDGTDFATHPEMHVYLTMSDGTTTLDSRDTGIAQLEDTYARVNFSEGVTSYVDTETVDENGNITTASMPVKADSVLVVKGLTSGTVTVKVTAEHTNGGLKTNTVTETYTVNIHSLENTDSWTYSNGSGLTDTEDTQLFNIDFDNDTTTNYNVFRVYSSSGNSKAFEFYNEVEQVMLTDTTNGVINANADRTFKRTKGEAKTDDDAGTLVESAASAKTGTISYDSEVLGTTSKSSNTEITGKSLFSWTPKLDDVSATGAYLRLNNSNTQRTDKIKVSYDFAMYNQIGDTISGLSSAERGTKYGMPQSISMISEGVQEGGTPYDFVPSSHYIWPEARPTSTEQINKHLLTFFTGRSKANKDGLHAVDMTNRLAYFEPRIGRYLDLGIELAEDKYNYFHVDADIDFLNSDIKFTITNVDTGAENTIATTIPKYASWSGFIMNSAQPNHMITNESGATELKSYSANHYMYLDNIKAVKTHEDQRYITPQTVPSPKPASEGSIINGKAANTDNSAWVYPNRVRELSPSPVSDGGFEYYSEGTAADGNTYTDFYRENNSGNNTGDKVNGSNDTYNFYDAVLKGRGVTQYIDLDFYLPKEGSFLTLAPRAYKFPAGNIIVITNAGVYSWNTMEHYTAVCGPLEAGKWYTLEIVTDNRTRYMDISVKEGENNLGTGRAYMRTIGASSSNGGDYGSDTNRIDVNEYRTSESSELPGRVWSEATTYVANVRYYEVATRKEYYPEGYTADQNTGDALNENKTADNGARLGYVLDSFDQNKVTGEASPISEGSVPEPQQSVSNPKATFTGWQEIYRSEDDRYIKYAPKFEVLDVKPQEPVEDGNNYYYQVFNTSVTRNAPDWTYDRIKWTVYDKYSSDPHMEGIWKIKTEDLPHNTGNFDLTVNISHCVFKIPIGTEITAEAQAGYSSYGSDWNSLPTELESTVTGE